MSRNVPVPAALVVGHPGHELRLFQWLQLAKPLVCVLTDGSGSGRSRIRSSGDLIAATGGTAGPVMGAFTDAEVYDLMLRGDVGPVVAVTEAIANAFVDHRITCVVADAFEFYNPTHDLSSVVATLAAADAERIVGSVIRRYDYAVTAATSGDGIVLNLDGADVQRKLAAAHAFENLTGAVDETLASLGSYEFAREVLRPVSMDAGLPRPDQKPFYERHGEERVAMGRYRTVLRYEEHFVPFVQELMVRMRHNREPAPHAAMT